MYVVIIIFVTLCVPVIAFMYAGIYYHIAVAMTQLTPFERVCMCAYCV